MTIYLVTDERYPTYCCASREKAEEMVRELSKIYYGTEMSVHIDIMEFEVLGEISVNPS
jgi:hypothetical protein